jgi:hypothetical protein
MEIIKTIIFALALIFSWKVFNIILSIIILSINDKSIGKHQKISDSNEKLPLYVIIMIITWSIFYYLKSGVMY